MSIGRTLIGILVLTTSICVFAQTTEKKPPDVGSGAATNGQPSATPFIPCPTGATALDQAEILTDTMDVDFGPYLMRVVQIVKHNWYDIMPSSVYPPIFKQGKVAIEFVILKNGSVSGMKAPASSGDVMLDRAAWGSITGSTPFPPLPKEFPGKILGLRFDYFYNLGIRISPCGDDRVPAGSTLQFSAEVNLFTDAFTDASVTWNVSGNGCSKSACGTISDTGLYTAPVDIPNPPTVIVKATSRTDISVPAKSIKVTIVQANPSH